MSDTVIEARGLTKRYGAATAVDGISFAISRGEIFGLLGPNGAGKTTTILMMLGLTEVTGGTVRVLGYDPVREPLAGQAAGRLSAGHGRLLRSHDGGRQPALHRRPDRHSGRPNAASGSRSALDRVGLADVANKRVGTFSRGMRQRLGLAEILMKDAAIAILDEPTSGLDPQATAELLDMIRALKRDGVAVLLSSHLLERVQSICDRVALFHSGRIALIGTVPELARQVLGGGYTVEVEADGHGAGRKARRGAGRALGRAAGAGPLPAAGRRRHAPAGRGRRGQRRRAACAGCRSRSRRSTRSTTATSRTRDAQHAA